MGRVCPPGRVGSMLLVWTDLDYGERRGAARCVGFRSENGRRRAVRSVQRGGLYADARPDHESVLARGQRWKVFPVASSLLVPCGLFYF